MLKRIRFVQKIEHVLTQEKIIRHFAGEKKEKKLCHGLTLNYAPAA